MSEKEHAADPVNAAFDPGRRRRRPRGSPAAASSVAPIARAPSSPRTGISLKNGNRRTPPARSRSSNKMRRWILRHHPPRDKEHQSASRKCRRESTPQTQVNAAFPDPGRRRRRPRGSPAAASSVAPIARAPSSPRTGISLKKIGNRRRRRPGQVQQQKMRRAGFSATAKG